MSTKTNHFIEQLNSYFKQEYNSNTKTVQAGNKDVFEACLDYLEANTAFDFEQKMTLMDYRVNYNHSLEAARVGKLKSAAFWLKKANELPVFENELLQKIVAVNQMPATAYYLYKEGNYQEAIALLKNTITLSGELAEKANIEYMVWGQMEDYINIFRAYCTQKDSVLAIKYAQAILLASLHGISTPGILENVSADTLIKAEIDFVSYATAESLQRLLRFDDLNLSDIIHQVFEPLLEIEDWSHCRFKNYKEAIIALKYATANQQEIFLEAMEQLLPNFYNQPNILQYFLLEESIPFILTQTDNPSDELLKSIYTYYKDTLGLTQSAINRSRLNQVTSLN